MGGDAASIADILHKKGITHVLVYDTGLELVRQGAIAPPTPTDLADWAELDRFRQQYLRLVQDFGEVYSLYVLELL